MHAPLTDLLRDGLPALLTLVAAIAAIRIVCRRPTLRGLSFAGGRRGAPGALLVAASEYQGPGADRANHVPGRIRWFFGLMGGDLTARG